MITRTVLGRASAVAVSLMLTGLVIPRAEARTHVADPAQATSRLLTQEQLRTERIALFQAALDLPEVRTQARAVGVDTERLKSAIPQLTDAELADLVQRAEKVTDVAAGHRKRRRRNPFYLHDTACLLLTGVALVALGLLLVAAASD
jgi:hypothetical protein